MRGLFDIALVSRGFPVWARYSLTAILVLLVAAVRHALRDPLPGYPFLLFFPVIIISSVLFDRGNGVFATILSALAVAYMMAPRGVLAVQQPQDFIALLVFLGVGLSMAVLIEALHRAYVNLAKSHAKLEAAANERAVLFRELSHRTRNDLATVAGLLLAQSRNTENTCAKAALRGAADRMQVVARVHQRLSVHDDGATVDTREFISALCSDLGITLIGLRPITFELRVESHHITIQRAVAVGLIVNELVTNALKYAFEEGQSGIVEVCFERRDTQYLLWVADDGFGAEAAPRGTGMGHTLVQSLAAQLGGGFERRQRERGSEYVVTFPIDPPH